jgi:(R,R)-butanediol dehydrogenase/meso-butanediol dehydrogenase/diacetyl reductase
VYGGGPIGLAALIAWRAEGSEVLLSDPSAERRAAARGLGAEHVIDPSTADVAVAVRDLTGGLGAAGAIDAAGAPAALRAALRSTRPDGEVVLVAHHYEPLELRSGTLIFSEVHVTGSAIYDADDFGWVIAAMAVGAYPLDGWVTTIELERVVEDGLAPLHARTVNKVLVRLAGEAS